MILTDEYQAAVNLGYITQEAAENEQRRWDVRGIDSEDELQRKAFNAGFLWSCFKFGWPMTDKDLSEARKAWAEWCSYLVSK